VNPSTLARAALFKVYRVLFIHHHFAHLRSDRFHPLKPSLALELDTVKVYDLPQRKVFMMPRSRTALLLALLTGGMITGQDGATYLDVYVAKVKPDKRAEFDAINKKMAALNRVNKGDVWLASETMYGEGNVVTFTSLRGGFGEAQKGFDLLMGALAKQGGMPAAEKIFQNFNNTVISTRSEMRRRRPDLGTNVPTNAADTAAVIGKARFLYTVTVRVRPGRALEYEDQIKLVKAARARTASKETFFVSQSQVGLQGTSYYITRPLTSLSDLDGMARVAELLGANGYREYQKGLAENTFSTEIAISRYLPELSNPPAEIAAVDPAFWNPKPMSAAKKGSEATK
jgi:hypothetical protein